jgi:hypothetical protein
VIAQPEEGEIKSATRYLIHKRVAIKAMGE